MSCSLQVSLSFTIQPYHPLSPPSPRAFNLSQHKGFSQWVGSSHQVAKVLELPLQHQSFQSTFRVDFLWDLLVWSPCSPGDSPEFSPATHFQSISFLALTLLNAPTLISVRDYWKNHSLDYTMIFFFDCSEFNISEINIYLNWFPESTNLNSLSTALTILAHQWFRSQDLEEKKSYEGRWSWKTGCTLVHSQKLHSPCSRVSQRCLASCAT